MFTKSKLFIAYSYILFPTRQTPRIPCVSHHPNRLRNYNKILKKNQNNCHHRNTSHSYTQNSKPKLHNKHKYYIYIYICIFWVKNSFFVPKTQFEKKTGWLKFWRKRWKVVRAFRLVRRGWGEREARVRGSRASRLGAWRRVARRPGGGGGGSGGSFWWGGGCLWPLGPSKRGRLAAAAPTLAVRPPPLPGEPPPSALFSNRKKHRERENWFVRAWL